MQISIIRVPAKEYLIIQEASCTAKKRILFICISQVLIFFNYYLIC